MTRVIALPTSCRSILWLLAAAFLVTVLIMSTAHADVTVGKARPSGPVEPPRTTVVPGTGAVEPQRPTVVPGTGAVEPQHKPPPKPPNVEHVWDPPGAPQGGVVVKGGTGRVVGPNRNRRRWHDTHEVYYHFQPGGLRIDTWVDRGEWGTYRPGDEIWIYFRVNRPCYVTILDYTTDGRVEVLYPNRWSSSSRVYPGRVYRVPDDRRNSLHIAGPGGIETLVACAHELPWPRGSRGPWLPTYHSWVLQGSIGGWGGRAGVVIEGGRSSSPRGRVVAGKPSGRVVVGGSWNSWSDWWPVHIDWHSDPGYWAYDSVSFRVASGYWDDAYWGGYLWEQDDWDDEWDEGSWNGGSWSDSSWNDGSWNDTSWNGGSQYEDSWDDGSWNGDWQGGLLLNDHFQMKRPSDAYVEELRCRGETAYLSIDCTESRRGDPTEIIGRLSWNDGWGGETLFKLDVEGRHGEVPREGRVFATTKGPLTVEIEIAEVTLIKASPWKPSRIKSIRFRVRATGCR